MRVKELLLRAAKAGGAMRLVRASQWRSKRLLVLCYHGVSMGDEHEWSPELFVSPERLRRRLRFLQQGHYNILPLADGLRRMYEGTLPPRSIAITFDDGGVDFARAAMPILQEFDACVTLYLTTYYSSKRLPVFDTMLHYVLWKGRASRRTPPILDGTGIALRTVDAAGRDATGRVLRMHADALALDSMQRNALVARVAAALGVDYAALLERGTLQIMPADAIRSLPAALVNVQLHTHRHRVPSAHADFVREIHENAAVIRSLRGETHILDQFAYPSGIYTDDAIRWLRECGVEYATTCHTGLASRASEPLLLPRFIDTMQQSETAFEAWATGFHALLPRGRTRFTRADASTHERRRRELSAADHGNASRRAEPSAGAE